MSEQDEIMIRVQNLKKQYRIGQIGGGTLHGDLESWWARVRGKEDPNTRIGTDQRLIGTTFMALNGVSFTVKKGEALGIIGANGAGKSTLLKLLTHVTAPTEGDIDLYGRVASMLEVGTGFHQEMTGRENVYLNGAILGMTRAEIDRKLPEIIEFSEVGDFIDTPVKRYSSGMYVKLAFSVAAHLDSEIMIMDEVLAVGDMQFQKKCLTKMREAATKQGRTILYVSHNMATIRELCDRCLVLDQGKIVFDGDPEPAIAKYLDVSYTTQGSLDCTNIRRASWIERDLLRFKTISLQNTAADCQERTQPLTIRYLIHAREAAQNVGIRLEILNSANTPVATAFVYGLAFDAGDSSLDIVYDLSALMPGRYATKFTLFTGGSQAGQTIGDEDGVPGLLLNLIDTAAQDGLAWRADVWGSVQLPRGKVLGQIEHTI